jgi:putative ABC transport system ATP-binding protein/lipoprotein-releasing system ATP-binding protein
MIGGIIRPSSGRIIVDDQDIFSLGSDLLSEYRCDTIGFMFQFASLLPMLTVKENLLLPSAFSVKQALRGPLGKKAAELLHLVGLSDKSGHYPAQLSGGQQRRVAIARAFMNDPQLILADEPTGDLDEKTEQEMLTLFSTMNRTHGITFIMVTHNTDLAAQARRRLVMQQGTIQEVH